MGRWRRTASATALALLLGTLVVLAVQHDGKPFTEVELNDGGVWVTNRDKLLVARVNPQIEELDLGLDAGASEFDIFQRATDLFIDNRSSARGVNAVDIARAAVQEPTSLPTGAVVAHGGGTFAVVDPVSGKAWVRPASQLASFSAKTAEPDATEAVTAAVGTDGRAYVLGRDGTVTPFVVAEGATEAAEGISLGEDVGTDPAMLRVTVVGDEPVLFNATTYELSRPGADPLTIDTPDSSWVELQQPSGDSDEVYLATGNGLYVTSVDGGDLERVSEAGGPEQLAGRPAAPVVLAGARCVYAAWADPDSPYNYLRDCADDADDDTTRIDDLQEGAYLQFRVNRDVVVLNDVETGDTWLVQDPGKAKVDNWPSVDPQNENRSKLKKTTEEPLKQENRPPEPQDDNLGARPGRSTVLPVVALNDHDPDGDIISISKTQHMKGTELEVKIVGGGTQLQVAVPPDATEDSVFRYYVTDGRATDERYAEVRLQIREKGQHRAPQLMEDRKPELTVASGATVSHYLLADFYDLDGDDLTLTDATARGGKVEFRPDGTVTFTDDGSGPGAAEIQYTIEDGFDTLTGRLPVKVVGERAPPTLVPDLKSGVAGTRVVVQPLTNDHNPEGTELTLKNVRVVGNDAGTEISKDLDSGTFTFRSERARSYYLEYSAYNSSATEESMIRLDIESPPKDNRPPIAVRDKAVISPGGTAQVDLLLNDLDPDGDVLVVKRIGRPSIPGVKVSVVDKRLAVTSSVADFSGQQVAVSYVVSDGRSSSEGQLVLAQRQSTQANRNPVANKDQVTVRAGSVTSIPVLANDSDPDGGKPRLFQSDLDANGLDLWVAGDALRLRAPEEPGTYSAIYGVQDADGFRATAEVAIYVVEDSAKNNNAPLPQPIIDRVISGRPKVISVDLVGADPDGDTVAFRGAITAPTLGRIVDSGVDWIRYEAFEGKAGTDFFQILVEDKYGATGVAEVRVGVVPEEAENQPPVALDDNVLVQPDRTISYAVLTNDIDPDDDPLRIEQVNSTGGAEADGGFIEVAVGAAPETGVASTNIGYSIRDAAGAEDNAVLKVTASRHAPFYAPIARDDVADLGDIIGKKPGASVEIPVLDNDLDFDGAKGDLRVLGCKGDRRGECSVEDDAVVEVELRADDQIVLYELDDADEESPPTFGVIFVSGTEQIPPQLTTDEDRVPVEVLAGERTVFDLRDLVVTRAGREPSIVPDTLPTAVNGAVSPVRDQPTSLAFTPARGHVGPASVTVAVSDGRSTAEDEGLQALVTVPIDVKPAGNVAPVMRDAAVDVTQGGDPALVDLAGLTRDANEDDLASMTYTVTSAARGLTATIAPGDSILEITAGGGTEDGETLKVTVVADDGNGGQAEATITARIVGTDRPLVQVPIIPVTAKPDELTSVDVADFAVNPYDDPIEVRDPSVEGSGRFDDLTAEGSVVSFVPVSSGTSTIKVTVVDASGDKAREVVARIRVTVLDRPDAPERPTISSVEASSLVLSWVEPESNGAPVTEYEVRGSHGFEQKCLRTTCQLVGLDPGEAYSFTVRARNSVDWSDPSPPSEEAVPNKAPDLMTPPTIVVEPAPTGDRMDRKLTVRWTPPANEGSAITEYEIKEAGTGRVWSADGSTTSKEITGLTNGVPYAFEIRAVNDVEPRRQFSGPSKAVEPFGIPLRAGSKPGLSASAADDYTARPYVRIDWPAWSESQSNGRPVKRYVITCDHCNNRTYEVGASETSKTFGEADGIRKGVTFTFTVAAENDAGVSQSSPPVEGRPWSKASAVENLKEVGVSPSDGVARIGWNPPADDGGLDIGHYVVQDGSGRRWTFDSAPGPAGHAVDFGSNGEHSVTVWAVTFNGGEAVNGNSRQLDQIHTWGAPGSPSGDGDDSSDYYQARIKIFAGEADGQDVTGIQYRVDGGAWVTEHSGFTYEAPVEEGGAQVSIEARTVSEAPDDARRYSPPVTLVGVSRAKTYSLSIDCLPLNGCEVEVSGAGFIKQDREAVVTISGLTADSECTFPFTRLVNGSFDFDAGGDRCKVSGNGTATASTSGISWSGSR